MIFEASRKF